MKQKLFDTAGDYFAPAVVILVTDSTQEYAFDPDSLPQVLTYDADGNLETITVTDTDGNQFRQTLTYTDGKVTGISAWVKL